jgi:hypothetical protein
MSKATAQERIRLAVTLGRFASILTPHVNEIADALIAPGDELSPELAAARAAGWDLIEEIGRAGNETLDFMLALHRLHSVLWAHTARPASAAKGK